MVLLVTPPSWRPDLTDPADLAEEVIRLEGYGNVPVRQPRATAGRGLSQRQKCAAGDRPHAWRRRLRRGALRPVRPGDEADRLMLAPEDPRRPAVKVANPLSEDQPQLRTTLLPGLFRTLVRNVGRGFPDTALFETGQVFLPRPGAPGHRADPRHRPRPHRGGARDARRRAARPAAARGRRARGRPRAARLVGTWPRGDLGRRDRGGALGRRGEPPGLRGAGGGRGALAPGPVRRAVRARRWPHGGHEWLAGHAGELHPRVIAAYGLPPRTSAFELDFAVLVGGRRGGRAGTRPRAVRRTRSPPRTWRSWWRRRCPPPRWRPPAGGAGELLEDLRLFDVYTGAQLAEGRKSLAYTLRLRAPDRTLTAAEATAARDAAVSEATRRTGAVLRASSRQPPRSASRGSALAVRPAARQRRA